MKALVGFHLTLAFFIGFLARGWWIIAKGRSLPRTFRRTVPDTIDTLLLASGLWLFVQGHHSLQERWLLLKLIAVFGYIALGLIALRRRHAKAFLAACACFALIVWLASVRPLP